MILFFIRHLFLWATTIFTSRSFSSRALAPQEGRYWTTYKTRLDGSRQAVPLDLSNTPTEDFKFPVLFPGIDVLNHSNDAKVDWTFAPNHFSIITNDLIADGDEVFNNYGPKGNDELLLGYGFCMPGNPDDAVALTLKPPPEELQKHLKVVQPGYFTQEGTWSAKQTTVRLQRPKLTTADDPAQIFYHLPEPLLELLYHIIRHEHGLGFAVLEMSIRYIASNPSEHLEASRYLPHIARALVAALAPKLVSLQSTQPSAAPHNGRQEYASMYRGGQVRILESLITTLRAYTRSLIDPLETKIRPLDTTVGPLDTTIRLSGPVLLDLESAITHLLGDDHISSFLGGIEANANTLDLTQLRLAGWEDDIWVLLICWLSLLSETDKAMTSVVMPEYLDPRSEDGDAVTSDELTQAESLMEIVHTADSALRSESEDGSLWKSERWSPSFIASIGGRMAKNESFILANDDGKAKLYVLFVFK